MDQYKNFKVEDFVWDTFFRQWVLTPTRESDLEWKKWVSQNPEISSIIHQSKQIVLSLKISDSDITQQEIEILVGQTKARISKQTEQKIATEKISSLHFYKKHWLQFAASVVLLVIAGLWLKSYDTSKTAVGSKIQSFLSKEQKINLIEKVNSGFAPMVVVLDDSSRITLTPGSKISYPEEFLNSRREVSLNGEAFFQISKDPERPFFVYANELITKVLGTSFTIKAYDSSREVTVEVKTGRVSVFAKSDPKLIARTGDRELDGIILSPNQKIIFERDAARMVKTLVEKPQIVVPKSQIPQFQFEDTPASEAFASIGKAYGIDILFDEDLLSGCPLTAALDSQTLHEKLSIICTAVEASYEILDGQIIIHSKGCRN